MGICERCGAEGPVDEVAGEEVMCQSCLLGEALYWTQALAEFAATHESPTHLWRALNDAQRVIEAAKAGKQRTEEVVRKLFGDDVAFRQGDQVLRVAPRRTTKCVDHKGVLSFAGPEAHRLIASDGIKVGELKKIAKERELEPQSVVDTFCEVQEGEPVVSILTHEVPKYLLALPEGEIVSEPRPGRGGKGNG